MLGFHGFEATTTSGELQVVRNDSFETCRQVWLTPKKHNFQQIPCFSVLMHANCHSEIKALRLAKATLGMVGTGASGMSSSEICNGSIE